MYDRLGRQVSSAYREIRQFYPKPGWVEHDPLDIFRSVLDVCARALRNASIHPSRIAAIGITNQRETTLLWDKKSGRPLHRAIVWQDRRTADQTEKLKKNGIEEILRSKTGLVCDPYFSATKIRWLLDQKKSLGQRVQNGRVCFGTVDSWLIWNLTGGKSHLTDCTNASRTLLFNIRTKAWDDELLRLMRVPSSLLPAVQHSGSHFGSTSGNRVLPAGIPILSVLGDQQAALYGQAAHNPGQVKSTFGTGCFILMNIGGRYRKPPFGLLTTIASDRAGKPVYAFEGAAFVAGAAIQWLRDGLKILNSASESEKLARRVPDSGGLRLIPAFSGLGSPYWEPRVRGALFGISRGTRREHVIRAALEAIAHQNADILDRMQAEAGFPVRELRVDGGATDNSLLMQFVADYARLPVRISAIRESTAWGAARLAGLMAGLWGDRPLGNESKSCLVTNKMSSAAACHERTLWKKNVTSLLTTLD